MKIYPAVDIKDGMCVRLRQGLADDKTVYFKNPVDAAKSFADAGSEFIHVVDLDGAFEGKLKNLKIIESIAKLGMFIELGGGMRDEAALQAAIDAGVNRAIIGTLAARNPELVMEFAQKFGEAVAVGIDAKDGNVAISGWVETVNLPALELAQKLSAGGVKTFIYTDISTDGMLTGPNLSAQETMAKILEKNSARLIASGGISCLDDISKLLELSKTCMNLHGVIVGKAIYEKRLDLRDAINLCS